MSTSTSIRPLIDEQDAEAFEGVADAIEKLLLLASEAAELPAAEMYAWIDGLKRPGADFDEPCRILRAAGRPDAAAVLGSIERLSPRFRTGVFTTVTDRADRERGARP